MNEDNLLTTLSVSFDVEQISPKLNWAFHSPIDNPSLASKPVPGPYAGSIYFNQGEILMLHVIGSGSKLSNFSSFQIVDCCITTRPQVVYAENPSRPKYAPPSPFLQAIGATYPLNLDFSSHLEKELLGSTRRRISQRWKDTLNVGHTAGRWDLSFNVTVRIFRGPSEAPELRVFYFDPESEVGDGTFPT
ncbi:MAG: hypothetical protein V4488_23980 [Pseudomonadota bacterium]